RKGVLPEPSDRDFHTPDDERFKNLFELKRAADEYAAKYDELRKQIIGDYKNYSRVRAHGVDVIKVKKSGNVDYKSIPVLKGIDLEKYRKPGREEFQVRFTKK